MAAGIPPAISELTLAFPYGDLPATEQLLQRYDGQIAALILEPTTQHDPRRSTSRQWLSLLTATEPWLSSTK